MQPLFTGLFLFSGILLLPYIGYTQQAADTVLHLPEIEVNEKRLSQFGAGLEVMELDSAAMEHSTAQNLSDLLSENSTIAMKSYGQGGLATINLRGLGPAQTVLLWNGINIQPSNIGLYDYALIPVPLVDEVLVQKGGSASLFGSGAMGGTVQLWSKPEFDTPNKLRIGGSAGSYGLRQGRVEGNISGKNSSFSIKTFYREQQNDFEYRNLAEFGEPLEELENAQLMEYGATVAFHQRFRRKWVISVFAWHSFADRNLPPTMTSINAEEKQKDWNSRLLAVIKKGFNKGSLRLRSALVDDRQTYHNPVVLLEDVSNDTRSFINELEGEYSVHKNMLLHAGLNSTYNIAFIEAYGQTRYQPRLDAFVSTIYKMRKIGWKAVLNLRQSWVAGYQIPFTPAFGIEGKIWRSLHARANVSRNFRIPTLNDRYWVPGGNPGLEPESGWSQEAGFYSEYGKSKKLKPKYSFTAFSHIVDNWIAWQPTEFGYWSPVNLQKVWSRGLEAETGISYNFMPHKFGLSTAYQFTKSTIEEVKSGGNALLGKQLSYVPEHSANAKFSYQWKRLYLSYQHSLNGQRFVSNDNVNVLPVYHTGNFSLSWSMQFKSFSPALKFKALNVWDAEYQVIQWRPMPGRNYVLSLELNIN